MNFTKWLIFAGLKVSEISGVIFIPYYYGQLMIWLFNIKHESIPMEWLFGLAMMVASMAIIFFSSVIIPEILNINQRLANKIYKRFNK